MENTEKDSNDPKSQDLAKNISDAKGKTLTTNQGLKVNDTNNSLKAGERGPTLLEDFILREKIFHFDHERIPERVVHARGSAAHGYFELYADQSEFTKAGIFTDTSRKTPLFTRFSNVAGSKGSADTARDVRGFAVKFYTEEGIFDFVGNNMPVFFIQDAIKFPDLVHAVKPEPDREIPQAASAHDTFYDFVSHAPETLHNNMWALSDRGVPRSLRMMEGFAIHTFRLINAEGKSHFVKFHWKPLLGVKSLTWDEAVKIHGADADFHRRDLWDAIDAGHYPEWELGFQIVPEEDEHKFDFDLLDATKLIPEEMVPVRRVGKMTLNRNPTNFFAETEQVAFHPGHVVPGIDFSNDPLLQGRLFSYIDTQLSRLGTPNFAEIPINRSINEVHNNQRDGHMRMTINKGNTAYFPNSLGGGCPHLASVANGGFNSYEERIDGRKIRGRSESFIDFYSQPALFYRSLQDWEKEHCANAYIFELGKCNHDHIKLRMLWLLKQINDDLASRVSKGLGLAIPDSIKLPVNQAIGADADVEKYQPGPRKDYLDKAPSLSQEYIKTDSIETRQIAVLVADSFSGEQFLAMKQKLKSEGAMVKIIAPHGGMVKSDQGDDHKVDAAIMTTESVLFDAVYIPGGIESIEALKKEGKIIKFINEALKHCKAIAATQEGEDLLDETYVKNFKNTEGICINTDPSAFVEAIAKHRSWSRESAVKSVPV